MEKFYLYNTLTRHKEELKPIFPPKVRIYTCGPTVYSHTHLGHMRTYTNTDVLVRALKYFGYRPYQVMNITDVGHLLGDRDLGKDKMEEAARREKKNAWEIAKEYTKEFFLVMKKLNIGRPDVVSKATDNIPQMILLVQELVRRGFAYKTKDGIYFDTSKVSDYGKLSHMPLEKLLEGARVEINLDKRNPADFALWKFTPPGVKRQMEWPSPWSKKSFPGWHIECSTMAMRYLSPCFAGGKFYPRRFETIDIHTGGVDHIPVHHTNEIAQTEAATGKKFVNYWFHNEFLQVEGRKMSKSLGNFYSLYDLRKRGYSDLLPLRYLFLNTHYRKKMNFTWEALAGAQDAYQQLLARLVEWSQDLSRGGDEEREKGSGYRKQFVSALSDDLNAPRALATLWRVVKSDLSSYQKRKLLLDFDNVLGLRLRSHTGGHRLKIRIPKEVRRLVAEREGLRKRQEWVRADQIRAEIQKLGYDVEDTPRGTSIRARTSKQ